MEYRTLKILENLLNDVVRRRLLPCFIWLAPIIETYSGFVSIALKDMIPWPEYGIFPFAYVDSTLSVIICTTAASFIHVTSSDLLQCVIKPRIFNGRNIKSGIKLRMRELRSCQPLKAKFGLNFADATTPLVVQDFCACQLASLIMLKNSSGWN